MFFFFEYHIFPVTNNFRDHCNVCLLGKAIKACKLFYTIFSLFCQFIFLWMEKSQNFIKYSEKKPVLRVNFFRVRSAQNKKKKAHIKKDAKTSSFFLPFHFLLHRFRKNVEKNELFDSLRCIFLIFTKQMTRSSNAVLIFKYCSFIFRCTPRPALCW